MNRRTIELESIQKDMADCFMQSAMSFCLRGRREKNGDAAVETAFSRY